MPDLCGIELASAFAMKLAMPTETRVRDVMHPGVIAIPATATVVSAAATLTENRVQGAPVVDGIGRIIGVVSTTDLTDPRRSMNPDDSIEWVMTRVAFAVRELDPLMTAVRLMVREAIHRVIVVDDAGRPVGMVTPMDVLRALDGGAQVGAAGESDIGFVRLDRDGP